jgi:tetratricopeptide (TPR) repeat protein
MKLFAQMRLVSEESDYYFNIGEIYMTEKQYQKTLESYMTGLRIDIKCGDRPAIAADYNMIGELYAETEQAGIAEEYFQRSLSLAGQIEARPVTASACYNLGLLYKKKRDKEKATEYLTRALEIFRVMGTPDAQEVSDRLKELESGSF